MTHPHQLLLNVFALSGRRRVGPGLRDLARAMGCTAHLLQLYRRSQQRPRRELLEQLAEGQGRLVIDLLGTRHVDSAGLGALMLIQRKAAERRLAVCLRGANEELRFLLVLTKLDDLFELESTAA